MVRSLYNRRPRAPQVKEWTTVQEATSWCAFGINMHGMHRKVFNVATGHIEANAVSASRGALEMVPAASLSSRSPPLASVAGFVDNVDWSEMQGKRVDYIERHLMSRSEDLRITLMAMLVAAEEEVTPFFLGQRNSTSPEPTLIKLTHLPSNPGLTAAQFISALWAGDHPGTTLGKNNGISVLGACISGDFCNGGPVVRKLSQQSFPI